MKAISLFGITAAILGSNRSHRRAAEAREAEEKRAAELRAARRDHARSIEDSGGNPCGHLFGANLSKDDLESAALAKGRVSGEDGGPLRVANVTGANLTKERHIASTQVGRADLDGRDLSKADLAKTDLSGADPFPVQFTPDTGCSSVRRTPEEIKVAMARNRAQYEKDNGTDTRSRALTRGSNGNFPARANARQINGTAPRANSIASAARFVAGDPIRAGTPDDSQGTHDRPTGDGRPVG